MNKENELKEQLVKMFPFMAETVKVTRARRIFAALPADKFADVLQYMFKDMDATILCTITGLDEGENFGVIYHLARPDGIMLNMHVSVPKAQPVLKSITPFFSNADIYERELVDLLGMNVTGLKPGSRYPLIDGWPEGQYPLRKDWKLTDTTETRKTEETRKTTEK